MSDGERAELVGYRRLACAVLVRAWHDLATNGNGRKAAREAEIPEAVGLAGDARAFLESDGARWLAALLDYDPAQLAGAVGELPAAEWGQLPLWAER